ncbi:DUF1849 family protein [Geminicoccaceae bacterium 1502E]|nr:DUF1849 family protein [Geminicoccaceae bacterium 1502E]
MRLLKTSAFCLIALLLLAARAEAAVRLLPHRAAYGLALATPGKDSDLAAVRGLLVLEWRPACDGWLSHQRLGFVATRNDGTSFTYDVRFSSWESLDNTQLRFNVRSYDAGAIFEEYKGEARLDGPGQGGRAVYVSPPDLEMALPPGTLFPTRHLHKLVERALAGERLVSHVVFDGSGPDALSEVTAVIAGVRRTDDNGQPRWPVTLAYHSIDASDALPVFELAFELAADGVLRDVLLDYGDFSLSGRLEKLEELPAPPCE